MRLFLATTLLWGLAFSAPTATAGSLLVNGGFETGNLTGWTADFGSPVIINMSGEMEPGTPHGGLFLMSSSVTDGGNRMGGPEITISQVIDVSNVGFISAGNGSVIASGFFTGAIADNGQQSDDLAQIIVEFYQGGQDGIFLGFASSAAIDPVLGFWNVLRLPQTLVPIPTDTIVFRVMTTLDPGFFSIDIGSDDLVLELFDNSLSSDTDSDGIADMADNCVQTANAEQQDTDLDGIGNLCDTDLNNDCITNVIDLGQFRSVFFSADPDADFNSDGTVNVVDLGVLRSFFFLPPGPSGGPNNCDI